MPELILPRRIIFGAECSARLAELAEGFGSRCLVVCGSQPQRHESMLAPLKENCKIAMFSVAGEPDVSVAEAGAERARAMHAELVVAVGGGSVLDAAKAIAALATNEGSPLRYLEVVGQGLPLKADPLPCIAVPTTAGTGSEATKNAVLTVVEQRRKVSLRDPRMLPAVALVDPLLLRGVPRPIAAAAGIDAFIQCAETFVCLQPNLLVDGFCREGMKRAARSLVAACTAPSNSALEDMAYASLAGGIALANAKLGAVHGFAGIIGGMSGAAHGAICGCLAPYVFAANLAALRKQGDGPDHLERFAEIGRIVAGPDADADAAVAWLAETVDLLELPTLSALGVQEEDLDEIAVKSQVASSMAGNPVSLPAEDLRKILQKAF